MHRFSFEGQASWLGVSAKEYELGDLVTHDKVVALCYQHVTEGATYEKCI